MTRRTLLSMSATPAIALVCAAQDKAALSQMVADLRQSLARNQEQLRKYTWTETVEMSLKGEAKKRDQFECRYDPSGQVKKTPIGAPPEPKKQKGLKGKIVANKVEDMKDYMDRVGSLVRRYVPPQPQSMKAAFEAGKASFGKPLDGSPMATLVFQDYAKPGDRVTLTLDVKSKAIRNFQVATYLDNPGDAVTLEAAFSTMAGGISYMERSVLNATAKQIQITTTNFGHKL